MLAFAHYDVACDKSRPKTPMPGGLHHEHRVVAAASGVPCECLAGELDTGLLASGILEGFVDARI